MSRRENLRRQFASADTYWTRQAANEPLEGVSSGSGMETRPSESPHIVVITGKHNVASAGRRSSQLCCFNFLKSNVLPPLDGAKFQTFKKLHSLPNYSHYPRRRSKVITLATAVLTNSQDSLKKCQRFCGVTVKNASAEANMAANVSRLTCAITQRINIRAAGVRGKPAASSICARARINARNNNGGH